MDIEFDSPRVTMYTEAEAKEAREDGVDLLEESRLLALSRSAIYQQGLRRYQSRRVKLRAFQEGDLVLWLIQRTAASTSSRLLGKAPSSSAGLWETTPTT